MDEDLVESGVPTVGERLRAAREAKQLKLEDIAAQTRIPQRHLESIETGDWESLPAPTYTTGFAKSYASAVGLDRTEIGDQLRAEMGGQRFATNQAEVFEAADPRRTMPKWLVIGTIIAVIVLVVLMSWLNKRSLEQPDETSNTVVAENSTAPAPPAARPVAQPAASVVQGQAVALTATDAVWLQITDKGAVLYSGILQAGQTFTVPPNAALPVLKTAKAEALKVTVGSTLAPQLGPPAKKVTVSLLAADLLKKPAQPAEKSATRRVSASPEAPAAAPAAAPETVSTQSAPTTNTGQSDSSAGKPASCTVPFQEAWGRIREIFASDHRSCGLSGPGLQPGTCPTAGADAGAAARSPRAAVESVAASSFPKGASRRYRGVLG